MTQRTASRSSPLGAGAPRIGVLQFPGSNCDQDCFEVLQRHFSLTAVPVWHSETKLPLLDAVILPGGFSFGDYLRSGALAAHSKIMRAVSDFVHKGGAALGICNGFQILTEAHLLPGALLRNSGLRFVCQQTELKVVPGVSPYQQQLQGQTLRLPIAHGEGRYYVDAEGLKRLEGEGQIAFRYAANPNGSVADIAGITSANGRVLGLMPHPERATDALLLGAQGSTDGLAVLKVFLASFL